MVGFGSRSILFNGHKNLGNGCKIDIWEDRHHGELVPLQQNLTLSPLWDWCKEHCISTLFHISKWLPSGAWAGWQLLGLPPHLQGLFLELCQGLIGCSPYHLVSKDSCGWGEGHTRSKLDMPPSWLRSTYPLGQICGKIFGILMASQKSTYFVGCWFTTRS
jgi:hypothetical protein